MSGNTVKIGTRLDCKQPNHAVVKMARRIGRFDVYADCEVRSVMRYSVVEDESASEMHRKICTRYGDDLMSVQSVRK